MKNFKFSIFSFLLILLAGCEQEVLVLEAPPTVVPPPVCPADATKGSADFTKFVAIGNSFVAGTQAGALFNAGQANSLPRILAKQFECVGGPTTFNQPDINSVNGYNIQYSVPNVITLGRLVLFDPDGTTGSRSAAPYPSGFPGAAAVSCPSAVSATPALPAPYNTADLPTAFTGNKAALNNFGVPFIFLGQALIPDTGNPASPYYNPLWARFASSPGVKSILTDAATAQGSFYQIWLGMDDVLLWAVGGADEGGTIPPPTSQANFNTQYNGLIAGLLGNIPATSKGVVGNVPNITSIPYFYTVPWNTIKLDAATVSALTPLSNGYNGALAQLKAGGIITEAEYNKRLISYKVYDAANATATLNGVLINDQDLTDLSTYFPNELDHMAKARQATATDLITLAAGSILGTCAGGNPQAVFGVSYPVADKHALTTAEITTILTRTAEYNAIISGAVTANTARLALADVNAAYTAFVSAKVSFANNVTITPSFAPPTGAFSEDGIHPNTRGYAFTANIFIDAINAKFGAKIPKASYAVYSGTGLPVNP